MSVIGDDFMAFERAGIVQSEYNGAVQVGTASATSIATSMAENGNGNGKSHGQSNLGKRSKSRPGPS